MRRILRILLSVPRSIIVNFRIFPFRTALKLPMFVANNVVIRSLKGKIKIVGPVSTSMIHIGYHRVEGCDERSSHTFLEIRKGSEWIIHGSVHVGQSAVIHVSHGAILVTGDNFAISGSTQIICQKYIQIGNDVQFSWDSVVMDSDSHAIFDEKGQRLNEDDNIIIGNHVWIGSSVTILKGTVIGNDCVVGACSKLSKDYKDNNCLIVGNPAKVVKQIGGWQI